MSTVAQDLQELLTPHKAARLLRASQSNVYRLLARGSIPAARVGGQWRIGFGRPRPCSQGALDSEAAEGVPDRDACQRPAVRD
jgi:excisionase family DNA binding protein